uniref:Uncharacterized protein n=1 Tax=Arcella intermedia TaxID=1963864 RepID=A0A6B2LQB1_9EUKA
MLCHQEVLHNPEWTIGAHFEVLPHKYQAHPTEYYMEFWDVGGAKKYALSRSLFFKDAKQQGARWGCCTSGLILVHDLSNKKSHANLKNWLDEFIAVAGDLNQSLSWGKKYN